MKNLLPFVFLICITGMAFSQNQGDAMRQEINLNQVYQQYSLTGNGVIVALIERGIDPTHPDFIDVNGNTRIAYLYDMIDQTGANDPNNPYGIGTIYTEADINQALSNNTPLGSTDRYGHGTACTGLAAGDGSGMTSEPYRGVAYGATIISVKLIHDAFPPTGNIAGQTGFFDPTYIPVALEFVKDKAMELGLPSVTLMNFGSIGGPTDGTSDISQAMEDFAGPGRLLVCGSGDDGGGPNRAADTLSQGESVDLQIQKDAAGNLRFEAWYSGDDRFDVTITRPNGSSVGPFTSPMTNAMSDQQFPGDLNYYHKGADVDFSNASNGKRQILIDLFGAATGTYTIQLTASTVVDGSFFASLNPAYFANTNGFLNQVFDGASINDYASSFNTIVPTDYVFDTVYTDLNGVVRNRGGQGAVGDIWIGSSRGPTLDGRIGVDIASPGEVMVGAYSPDTYYSQFAFNIAEGSNGLYGVQTAVSAAAPVLTGVLALMLEVNPSLTVAEAKTLLHQSARTDAFTGSVPNITWGYGKLDALAAVQATQSTLSLETLTFEELQFSVFPNPAHEQLFYRWESADHAEGSLKLLDIQGKIVGQYSIARGTRSIMLPDVPAGLYLVQIYTDQHVGYSRLMIR